MKHILSFVGILVAGISLISCGGAHGDNPGRTYMPDMWYSRAYEAYGYNNIGDYERLKEKGVNYTGMPVAGTMARGDAPAYPYPGTDSGYAMAVNFKSPYGATPLTKAQRTEAERLYLINCAICHGTNLDGNGPLWKGGDGPYPAAPRNLTDDYSKKLADGQMYHVIMYGKGQMGSYASQVHPEQRWWIIRYIREKQGVGGAGGGTDSTANAGGATASGAGGATKTDTTKAK
ncbi:MAG: cytochrome c [Flavisolibacter sp.]|nr:cytochrome c [Flavisolibacter sp.]